MAEQKPFHLTRHTSIYFEIERVISKNGIDLLLCYIFMEFTIFFSCWVTATLNYDCYFDMDITLAYNYIHLTDYADIFLD